MARLLSYRFMLTPSSALEANYGITYENNIHYYVSNTNNYKVITRTQEISAAYVRSFVFKKFNPFVEAGPARLHLSAHSQLRHHLARRQAADRNRRRCTAPASPTRSAPASTFAPNTAAG